MSVSSSDSQLRVLQSPPSHSELHVIDYPHTQTRKKPRGRGATRRKKTVTRKATITGHVGSSATRGKRYNVRKSKGTKGKSVSATVGKECDSTGQTNSHSSTPGSSGRSSRIPTTGSVAKCSVEIGTGYSKHKVAYSSTDNHVHVKKSSTSTGRNKTIVLSQVSASKSSGHPSSKLHVAQTHSHVLNTSGSPAKVEADSTQTTKKNTISNLQPVVSGHSTTATTHDKSMPSRVRVRGAWMSGSSHSCVKLTSRRISTAKCRASTDVSLLSETESVSTNPLPTPTPSPSSVANWRPSGSNQQRPVSFSRWNKATDTTTHSSHTSQLYRMPRRKFATTVASRGWGQGGQRQLQLEDVAAGLGRMCYRSVIVMSGAGISTPSGIPDFRTPGTGLYDNLQKYQLPEPSAVFDAVYFNHNPRPFFSLAKELYPGKYSPNLVHCFVRLLQDKGVLLRNYTQNIDGLERLAGVQGGKLVEAHGSFSTASCTRCHSKHDPEEVKNAIFSDRIPRCKHKYCSGVVKPNIVFFGEDLPQRFHSLKLPDFSKCDLLLVMGTSLEVEPFASLVTLSRHSVPRLLFNREMVGPFRSSRCRHTDVTVRGDVVESVRVLVQGAGWEVELEDIQRTVSKDMRLHAAAAAQQTTTSTSSSRPAKSGSNAPLSSALRRMTLQSHPPQTTADSDSSDSSSSSHSTSSSLSSDSTLSESESD